ncbi:hypothetical protein D918_02648 [Trichuris suis]|nr:hypothetical protein D918_02648 [Trichuris suis]
MNFAGFVDIEARQMKALQAWLQLSSELNVSIRIWRYRSCIALKKHRSEQLSDFFGFLCNQRGRMLQIGKVVLSIENEKINFKI